MNADLNLNTLPMLSEMKETENSIDLTYFLNSSSSHTKTNSKFYKSKQESTKKHLNEACDVENLKKFREGSARKINTDYDYSQRLFFFSPKLKDCNQQTLTC